MAQNESKPYCFGKLETVFPMGPDGFRQTPESCFVCIYKTGCLKSAMGESGGIQAREESVDRAYRAGMIGFWARWSQKKMFKRRIRELEKEAGDKKSG
ncbi:MAG: hypothetical protein H8D81_02390 [Deltaproteobacteria bacterium]|nr:hypothetical protein [Deltaproteobacteria bacterium]